MRIGFKFLITALFLFAAFVINSLGVSSDTARASSEQADGGVNIKLFTFKPATLEVPVGTEVVWTNGDAVDHTVTAGTPEEPGKVFDSGSFNQGATYSFTFTEAGDYPYFCARHTFMRGSIKVVPSK